MIDEEPGLPKYGREQLEDAIYQYLSQPTTATRQRPTDRMAARECSMMAEAFYSSVVALLESRIAQLERECYVSQA